MLTLDTLQKFACPDTVWFGLTGFHLHTRRLVLPGIPAHIGDGLPTYLGVTDGHRAVMVAGPVFAHSSSEHARIQRHPCFNPHTHADAWAQLRGLPPDHQDIFRLAGFANEYEDAPDVQSVVPVAEATLTLSAADVHVIRSMLKPAVVDPSMRTSRNMVVLHGRRGDVAAVTIFGSNLAKHQVWHDTYHFGHVEKPFSTMALNPVYLHDALSLTPQGCVLHFEHALAPLQISSEGVYQMIMPIRDPNDVPSRRPPREAGIEPRLMKARILPPGCVGNRFVWAGSEREIKPDDRRDREARLDAALHLADRNDFDVAAAEAYEEKPLRCYRPVWLSAGLVERLVLVRGKLPWATYAAEYERVDGGIGLLVATEEGREALFRDLTIVGRRPAKGDKSDPGGMLAIERAKHRKRSREYTELSDLLAEAGRALTKLKRPFGVDDNETDEEAE